VSGDPPLTFICDVGEAGAERVPMGSAHWKKLKNGDWAVENEGTPARVGEWLAVHRRSGGIDKVVVRKVLWEGAGKQWLLASRASRAERGGGHRARPAGSSP
jgi:hypothetical protein